MARAAIFSLLSTDPELIAMGLTNATVYGSNATDTPDRTKLFMVIKLGARDKAFGLTGSQQVVVWIHKPRELGADYGDIDAALVRVRELMTEAMHRAGGDGWTLSEATWLGDSTDLFDDGYQSLTRNATFRIASRPVVTP